MAGFTDAPFRRLAQECGATWAVTEMVLARGFLAGEKKAFDLGAPFPGERNIVVQLFGDDPAVLHEATAKAEAEFLPAAIDLNMGCPAPKLVGRGGACLLQTPENAYALVSAMRSSTKLDISAKIRLGWDSNRSIEIAQGLEQAGANLITVHGRTSAQRYTGSADWDAIAEVAKAVSIPVVGSGDVKNAEEIRLRATTGVQGIMIGRGAVGNPWIFTDRQNVGLKERISTALRHAELNINHYGELTGIRQLRKVLPKYFPDHNAFHLELKLVDSLEQVQHITQKMSQAASPGFM